MNNPRKLRYLFVSIGFIALVSVVFLYRLRSCPQLGRKVVAKLTHRRYFPGSDVQFTRVLSGSGVGPRGSDFEIFQFRSSDCTSISSWYNRFKSEPDAQADFAATLSSADRVLERAQARSSNGQIGERAVVWKKAQSEYVIVRRFGTRVHSIASDSLGHALELEKRVAGDEDEILPASHLLGRVVVP